MIIYVLKEKISFNYPSFSHINLNNIVYCMHAIFIVTTHKYLQRVSCRDVYVLHTYILSLYNVLSLLGPPSAPWGPSRFRSDDAEMKK